MATKLNLNEQNDNMHRNGIKKVNTLKQTAKRNKELFTDSEVKKSTMDFIFGKTTENPLVNRKDK